MGTSASRLPCGGLWKHLAKRKVQSVRCHSCGNGYPENEVLSSISASWAFHPRWEKPSLSGQSSPLACRNAATATTPLVTMAGSRSFSCVIPWTSVASHGGRYCFCPQEEGKTEAQSSWVTRPQSHAREEVCPRLKLGLTWLQSF